MTEREALKLALEALKYPLNQSHENFNVDMAELLAHRAITGIKEALTQPEPENITASSVIFDWEKKHGPRVWEAYARKAGWTPQRKPLTDEEIILIVAECAASHQHTDIHFARAIERAHGIKELV